MPQHAFISYSRKDTTFVEKLEKSLESMGIETWRDAHNIPSGEGWYRAIVDAIKKSCVMLCIVSPHADQSKWVLREQLYADEHKLKCIPILPAPHPMPFHLIETQPIDCNDKDYDNGLAQISARILDYCKQAEIIIPNIPTENDSEGYIKAYLNFLLAQTKADLRDARYVKLSAIAEQHGNTESSSVLGFGLEEEFDFERLGLEQIRGEEFDKPGKLVPDAREPLRELRRVILLGEPGSGKTTTLLQLVVDLVHEAGDSLSKLPVFVPLRQFDGSTSFETFVQQQMFTLQSQYSNLLEQDRLILLLDALNEMPRKSADGRQLVHEVRQYLQDKQDWIISCRIRDYKNDLSELGDPAKVCLKSLDPPAIYDMILRRFSQLKKVEEGEKLWRLIGGSGDLLTAWKRLFIAGTPETFWRSETPYRLSLNSLEHKAWSALQGDKRRMMSLCRNPYMTNMVIRLYALNGELPANRGALFASFVDELLKREETSAQQIGSAWLPKSLIQQALSQIAYTMRGETEMLRSQAESILNSTFTNLNLDLLFQLAISANLLDVSHDVRFTHQLLQEYFAGEVMGQLIDKGKNPSQFWREENWWESNGREESLIIIAGVREDPETVARWVAPAQPLLAYQVLSESGIELDLNNLSTSTKRALIEGAAEKIRTSNPSLRNRIFMMLGLLNADNRDGIGLKNGLPDISWCHVPAGTFLMGSDKSKDSLAKNNEFPQREVELNQFFISKYPITNAQYMAFVDAGGYERQEYWTKEGWNKKEANEWTQSRYWDDENCNASNQPVVGVSWYEAYAYTNWLNSLIRSSPAHLPQIKASTNLAFEIHLPTEQEWEKAARGTNGRIYPYGDKFDASKGNTSERGIGISSVVGIFPNGASPYGVMDMRAIYGNGVSQIMRSYWESRAKKN